MLLIPLGLFCLHYLCFVSSQEIHICNEVTKPPVDSSSNENCSLLCGFFLHQYIVPHGIQEVGLCIKDEFTPILCESDEKCNQYHRGSYCKKVQCACETNIIRKFLQEQKKYFIGTCVASNWLNTHSGLVSFPWKTVVAVFGTLGLLVIIFMGFRWLYPILQSSRRDDRTHRQNNEHCISSDVGAASPLCIQLVSVNPSAPDDKPPSYETITKVTDIPPSYEETITLPYCPQSEDIQNNRQVTSPLLQEASESRNEAPVQLSNK